ncbi:MAG TPA: FMN-binding protein [Methylomirabilota bacterium]|nr:FMN-binding protein [Methylomirabilota bacterium]
MAVLNPRLGIGLVIVGVALAASGAPASTLTPLDEALARAFPGARIEQLALALSATDVKAVEQRAHARCEARLVTAYVAWHGDTLVGTAYTDRRVVRTREALLMTTIAPDTTVARIDVLAFFEPPDYRPSERWLARFKGAHANVPPIAGASLTSRAVSECARLALAWHALRLVPELAKRTAASKAQEEHR